MNCFAEWMDKQRRKMGLSTVEFCDWLGIKYMTLYEWYNDNCYPTIPNIIKLAGKFKIYPEQMLRIVINAENADPIYDPKETNFCDWIERELYMRCMTRQTLEYQAALSKGSFGNWKYSHSLPHRSTVYCIARVLEVNAKRLILAVDLEKLYRKIKIMEGM